ncbi:MAG TPA: NAD(P)-dependent oxidoreductase [Rhizobacter sp.]|nr:NAD(P)-dependent oxidoreductase [Rhizobacter sp.]
MTSVFLTHPPDKLDLYFGTKALHALQAVAEVRLNPEPRELSVDELAAAAQGCAALIAYRQTPGPRALFEALPGLKAFIRCAVDIRSVDVDAARANGVLVTHTSAGYVPAVCEWIVGAMVALGRGTHRYAEARHRGQALPPFMGRELRGAVLGVIGYGQIGRGLVEIAQVFGMQVLVTSPTPVTDAAAPRQVPLATLLAGSDFVVCLAAATPQTERLMDAPAFAALKPGACFINASRGELVDDAALLHALDAGRLAGCALDVGRAPDQMPTPELARHPLVLATPHIGGLTQAAVEHQALETVAQFTALLRGEVPPGAVNAPT